jgi:hypothetical protein
MFDLLRFLPQIESGAISVRLQALRLPLVSLAFLLTAMFAHGRPFVRWMTAVLGSAMAALTLPPYPQILTAWRTPGWQVPFWWAVGCFVCLVVMAWQGSRLRWVRYLAMVLASALGTVPAAVTLTRLLPALVELHQAPVPRGWGFWLCMAGLGVIGLYAGMRLVQGVTGVRARQRTTGVSMSRGGPMSHEGGPEKLRHITEVKNRHEAELLEKANVVAVGVGLPIVDGQVTGTPGIIVSVTHKVAAADLAAEDLVPQQVEDVPVWVQEVDRPRAAEEG